MRQRRSDDVVDDVEVILVNMCFGMSAKPSSLHIPDKRGAGSAPAIEILSFASDQKIDGNIALSG